MDFRRRRYISSGNGGSTLLDGLEAYWKLDEIAGNALDPVNSYDGTLINSPTQNSTGKVGTAYVFDRTSLESTDHGTIVGNVLLNDLTISVWVYVSVLPSTPGKKYGVFGNWGGEKPYFHLQLYQTDRVWFTHNFTGANIETTSNSAINVSTWYHIVIRMDRDGTTSMYVNNVLQTSTHDISGDSGTSITNSNTFSIGKIGNALADRYFDGTIDEVGLWYRLLTPDEITLLYNSGNGITYPFT